MFCAGLASTVDARTTSTFDIRRRYSLHGRSHPDAHPHHWPGGVASETTLAKGKLATQSSTDSNGANVVTANQAQPCWPVDLGACAVLTSVRLWNRTDSSTKLHRRGCPPRPAPCPPSTKASTPASTLPASNSPPSYPATNPPPPSAKISDHS